MSAPSPKRRKGLRGLKWQMFWIGAQGVRRLDEGAGITIVIGTFPDMPGGTPYNMLIFSKLAFEAILCTQKVPITIVIPAPSSKRRTSCAPIQTPLPI